jgi:hypothetical protein
MYEFSEVEKAVIRAYVFWGVGRRVDIEVNEMLDSKNHYYVAQYRKKKAIGN